MRVPTLTLVILSLGTVALSSHRQRRQRGAWIRPAQPAGSDPDSAAPIEVAPAGAGGSNAGVTVVTVTAAAGAEQAKPAAQKTPAAAKPAVSSSTKAAKATPKAANVKSSTPAAADPPKSAAANDPAKESPGGSSGGNGDTGGGTTQSDWITAHTNARKKYGVSAVTWSAGAAAQAQANVKNHAGDCTLGHTSSPKFGENLRGGEGWGGGKTTAQDNVDSWMSEAKNFNYADPNGPQPNSGDKMTGHFTAIVWKDMHAIGCAVGPCGKSGTYIACCYDPFPNMGGQYDKQVPELVS